MQSHELGLFLKNKTKTKKTCPRSSGERLNCGYAKFDFTVDEEKKRLNPSRGRNEGKHRRRKVDKSWVTFLLCDPGWCVHKSDVQNKRDGNTHNTHTPDSVYVCVVCSSVFTSLPIWSRSRQNPCQVRTIRENRKLNGAKTMSLGTKYSFCVDCRAASISEPELQATEKTL